MSGMVKFKELLGKFETHEKIHSILHADLPKLGLSFSEVCDVLKVEGHILEHSTSEIIFCKSKQAMDAMAKLGGDAIRVTTETLHISE